MKPLDVYPLFDISLVKGEGCHVWDDKGNKYLDLYGGHAVISIGHNHPKWTKAIKKATKKLAYYSNSVHLPLQEKLAQKLGELSGYPNYNLFLCNSGAEANENALKLASFTNQRNKIIAFKGAFHGRTAAAVAVTDNPKIKPPINPDDHVIFLPLNDKIALEKAFSEHEICAVIIEPFQGVNGIYEAKHTFLKAISALCKKNMSLFIIDEIQSGYGRTGHFFAHQWAFVKPDIITMAKGMGNGFPIAGILVNPEIKVWHGMLGTTFGGAPMACAAGLSVLKTIESEKLIERNVGLGEYFIEKLRALPFIKEIRGRGLILGVEFDFPIKGLRERLVYEKHIFTGNASNPNTLRFLPPMNIRKKDIDKTIKALQDLLSTNP
ncbi:MAG: aspartate aminotransferase family protein [Bacteroidetes bacterium]|nr:aspartate aminotransferase family protein [Bacteroidota bacterium]